MAKLAGVGVLVACALLAAACSANRNGGGAAECTAMEGNIVASTQAETLAGEYRLTMVATSGAESSHTVTGDLKLIPHEEDARNIRRPDGSAEPGVQVPLYGTTTIALTQVGAVPMGDLGSTDPMRPGVAVLEQRSSQEANPPSITLRLGSLANQRDVTRFDGGYAALRVEWVASGRFGGSWESGVTGPEAAGYFCAFSR